MTLNLPVHILPDDLARDIWRLNPWWEDKPLPVLPEFKRWPFPRLLRHISSPMAPALVLRGPRQIGKTTLQLQLVDHLLESGMKPQRILRVQFDELPGLKNFKSSEAILRIVDWFEAEIARRSLNQMARDGQPAILLFDEVQNLDSWDVQTKFLVDSSTVRVFITGSSALRIEAGRDSLAGRIQTLEVGPLHLYEIASLRKEESLTPFQADNGWAEWKQQEFWRELNAFCNINRTALERTFHAFSERGGYPLAQRDPSQQWSEIADQLVENVVQRVIQHDLRMGERGRKRDEQLLEEVFRTACRYAGQFPSMSLLANEAREKMGANVGPQRINAYLRFLDSSLLVHLVQPLEIRLKRQRSGPKICLSDHAIRAAWLQEIVPLTQDGLRGTQTLSTIAGHVVESIVGYTLSSLPCIQVAHVPPGGSEPEIDFVITIGDMRIPVEVKYQSRIDPVRDVAGMMKFLDQKANNAAFGLFITQEECDFGELPIIAVPLKHLLMVK